MKKTNLCILTLAVAAICLVSCKKEENGDGKHFTATIATDTKTILDGTTLKWVSGDNIKIFGTNNTAGCVYTATPRTDATWADFTFVSGNNVGTPTFSAIYPASAAVSSNIFTINAEQTYATNQIVDFPMFAQSNNYDLVFKNLCGAVKIRLTPPANTTTPTTITGIKITTDTYINGDYTISDGGETITAASTTNHTNSTMLTCNQTLSASGNDFYVFLPAGNYQYFEIKLFNSDGKTSTKRFIGNSTNTLQVTRSKYTLISFSNPSFAEPPAGALSGFFTINSNGDKVRFSKGNLIKTGDNTYAFCDQQYHYTESNATAYLHTGQRSYSGLNITNGGGSTNTWRGMRLGSTSDAGIFTYVPSTIPSRATYRWALVKVNGTGGIILFPDNFYWPWDNIPEPADKNSGINNSTHPDWNGIDYTTAQWQILEEAGCVFLPSYNGDDQSRYWYTTVRAEGTRDEDDDYQYYIKFTNRSNTFSASNNSSTMGVGSTNAVRLIMDVTASMLTE